MKPFVTVAIQITEAMARLTDLEVLASAYEHHNGEPMPPLTPRDISERDGHLKRLNESLAVLKGDDANAAADMAIEFISDLINTMDR